MLESWQQWIHGALSLIPWIKGQIYPRTRRAFVTLVSLQ